MQHAIPISQAAMNTTYLHTMTWEEKARVNPLYGIMSVPEFVSSDTEPSTEELAVFLQHGRDKVGRWIIPWLGWTPGHVLEFGCGAGRLLSALNERGYSNLYGVDISPSMIELAHKLVPEADTRATEGSFPFPDASMDAVYSYAVFQHIRSKRAILHAISEIGRVLKPGGRVKLQFAMLDQGRHLWTKSWAFERIYISYGWTHWNINGRLVPLWRAQIGYPNNWDGNRLGYGQIVRALHRAGIRLDAVERGDGLVWFLGTHS